MISLVIPAYNEGTVIGRTVDESVAFFENMGEPYEIIPVDDGSKDATREEMLLRSKRNVRPVYYDENGGKGKALKTGVATSRGDVVILSDADLAYGLSHIPEAVGIVRGGADIVTGSRWIGGQTRGAYPPLRRFVSWGFKVVMGIILPLGLSDTQCGFKAVRGDLARELFSRLETTGYAYDLELLARAVKIGCSIREIPTEVVNHGDSKVSVVRDSIRILRDAVKIRRIVGR